MKVPHIKSIINFEEDTALELVSYSVLFLYSFWSGIITHLLQCIIKRKKRTLLLWKDKRVCHLLLNRSTGISFLYLMSENISMISKIKVFVWYVLSMEFDRGY